MHTINKIVNLLIDFKEWQTENVIKPIYWSKESYPTMFFFFLASRARRNANIIMRTFNVDWLIDMFIMFMVWDSFGKQGQEMLSHPNPHVSASRIRRNECYRIIWKLLMADFERFQVKHYKKIVHWYSPLC